jgi:hypothetical protein
MAMECADYEIGLNCRLNLAHLKGIKADATDWDRRTNSVIPQLAAGRKPLSGIWVLLVWRYISLVS